MITAYLETIISYVLKHLTQRLVISTLFCIFYVITSLMLMGEIVRTNYLFTGLSIDSMMDGTSLRPFVYRVLPVAIVRAASYALPLSVQHWVLSTFVKSLDVRVFLTPRFLVYGYWFQGVMFLVTMYSFLIGYGILLRKMAQFFFPGTFLTPLVAPMLGFFALFPFIWPRSYMYDFGVLFTWSACFYALARHRWAAYLFFFTLACLNKETAIVMVMFYAIYCYHLMPLLAFLAMGILQLVIYACIRTTTLMVYSHNGGFTYENHLNEQIFGYMMGGFDLQIFMVVLFALFLIVFRWQDKPLFLRQGLWLFFPFYALYRIGGCCGEWRVYYEIHPILILLSTHTLVIGTGMETVGINRGQDAKNIPASNS